MKDIFRLVERIAPSNVSVLVTGESGTGKELVARALHELSARRNKPFVAVNCAAIPETLIESEIFRAHGRARESWRAGAARAGCFELAEEGTLLLDDRREMPAATQRSAVESGWRIAEAATTWEQGRDSGGCAGGGGDKQRSGASGGERGAAWRSVLPPERDQHSGRRRCGRI